LNGQTETLAVIYARIFRYAQQNQVGAAPVYIPKQNSSSVMIGQNHHLAPVTRRVNQDSYRVLLSVKVREDIGLNLTQWKEWLTPTFLLESIQP
jgi:hypothetical protein